MRIIGSALTAVGMMLLSSAAIAEPLPQGAHFVAMGSSFAAGAGIGTVKQETPGRCGRSRENYATLLAARLHLTLDDQTCNGARTTHLLNRWNELAAQLDAVRTDTRLVTATIGGNDINYAAYLLATACGADNMVAMSGNKMPCPPHAIPTEADYAQLEANMRQIVRRVKARAPQARFVFVQYVTLVPPRPCDAAPLSAEQAAIGSEIGRRLAVITARAAQLEGGEVLAADQLSRHHTACDAKPWSVGAKDVDGRQGVLWHPSRLGHVEIAKALARLLEH